MRILAHVHKYPPVHNAGAEWMLHTILRRFVELGHEAYVHVGDGFDVAPYELHGVTVFAERRGTLPTVARGADVIFTHLDRTQEAVEAARYAGIPLVHLVHNLRQLAFHAVRPEDANLVVPNSYWLAEALEWPGRQIVCRPHVIVSDYELPNPWDRDYVTLVNVTLEKGAARFYELAAAFPERRFLAVAGAYGIQAIRRVPANVKVLQNTANIAGEVYARTRVLLMPSEVETWGRVAIEAGAAGIPTIAHPTEGLVEALGSAGIFVDRRDGTGWENELRHLDDPAEYLAASNRARMRAVDLEAETAQDVDRLVTTVEELVRSSPPAEPYDAAMAIFDSARAGIRCPICGHHGCACKPTADDVYSRLQANTPAVDVVEASAAARGRQRTYRTARGDFILDDLEAEREGFLAGDRMVRATLSRLAPWVEPEELELIAERYRTSTLESRQAFLTELALVDGHRTSERLEGLLEELEEAPPEPVRPEDAPPGTGEATGAQEPAEETLEAALAGRVGDVANWVGSDPARAREALEAEQAGKARPTLVARLTELAG